MWWNMQWMRYLRKEDLSLLSTLKILIFISRTIRDCRETTLDDYTHDTNFIRKIIFTICSRQLVFVDDFYRPSKAKIYSGVLAEEENIWLWYASDRFLSYLMTVTMSNPKIAEFRFVQYVALTSPLGNVNTLLTCVSLLGDRWQSLSFFSYIPWSSKIVEVKKWYRLVPFSSSIFFQHISRWNSFFFLPHLYSCCGQCTAST